MNLKSNTHIFYWPNSTIYRKLPVINQHFIKLSLCWIHNASSVNILIAASLQRYLIQAQFQNISDPDKIGQLLSDSIFEAHQRTCLLSRDQIQAGCSQGINDFKVEQYKKMVS